MEDLETYYSVLFAKYPLRRPVDSLEEAKNMMKEDPEAFGASIQTRKATPWVTVENV